jgi:hypothetical protein
MSQDRETWWQQQVDELRANLGEASRELLSANAREAETLAMYNEQVRLAVDARNGLATANARVSELQRECNENVLAWAKCQSRCDEANARAAAFDLERRDAGDARMAAEAEAAALRALLGRALDEIDSDIHDDPVTLQLVADIKDHLPAQPATAPCAHQFIDRGGTVCCSCGFPRPQPATEDDEPTAPLDLMDLVGVTEMHTGPIKPAVDGWTFQTVYGPCRVEWPRK